jgi:hypothetical protein
MCYLCVSLQFLFGYQQGVKAVYRMRSGVVWRMDGFDLEFIGLF